ncbi:MAG: GAF domain-containing protein [Chloroflexi bacterium]|nr:GAF domain-containing protein [Chloroflexota bacterium]
MKELLRILIVEDSEDDSILLVEALKRGGYDVISKRVETREELRLALADTSWDIILSDHALPQFSSFAALELLAECNRDLPLIIVSGTIGEETAAAAMRAGASDYILKGNWPRLVPAIKRELQEAAIRRDRRAVEEDSRRHAARAEALVHTAARLNAQLDLEGVLDAICEETVRALHVPAASVVLYDEISERYHHAASLGLPLGAESLLPLTPPSISPGSGNSTDASQKSIVVLPDLRSFPDEPGNNPYTKLNIRSLASIRLERNKIIIGYLNIFAVGELREFTTEEIELLKGLSNQAVQAIANARLFEEARRRLHRISALNDINLAISGSLDLRTTLNILLTNVTSQLEVDAACVLLFNKHNQKLEYMAGRGFRSSGIEHSQLRAGEGYAGQAVFQRRTIYIPDLRLVQQDFVRAPLLASEEFITYFAVPLISKGQVKGVMDIFHRSLLSPDQEWQDFLETLGSQAAIAIDNAELFNNLQRSNTDLALAYDATIESWSRALDLRDRETEGHTHRVTQLTMQLARSAGFRETDMSFIRYGAMLHDIGKMVIPDTVLLKPGPLTPEEWEIMRQHPIYAFELLSPIAHLRPALDIPYSHHERWNGSGYPRKLQGAQIPLTVRIFSIADVWDALNSDRPYRPAWPRDKALEYIHQNAGTLFDPQTVEMFINLVNDPAMDGKPQKT